MENQLKNLNKSLIQGTRYPLENLSAVCELTSTGEVNSAMEQGAVLLGVGQVEGDESTPFRFALGLPKEVHANCHVSLKALFGLRV
jgi:hypothetical protein